MTTKQPGIQVTPLAKDRAADQIVQQLGMLIVKGDLKVGEALPSERVLGEQFGVARGTVRQAIHKLSDWGLVQTRPGGITRVANHEDANAVEVIELRYRVGPVDDREYREWIQRRMLQGVSIVGLAELQPDPKVLDELEANLDRLAVLENGPELHEIEMGMWIRLAQMGKNRFFEREVKWFARMAIGTKLANGPSLMTPMMRASFYRELLRRVRASDGAARYYLELCQMLFRSAPDRI